MKPGPRVMLAGRPNAHRQRKPRFPDCLLQMPTIRSFELRHNHVGITGNKGLLDAVGQEIQFFQHDRADECIGPPRLDDGREYAATTLDFQLHFTHDGFLVASPVRR